MNPTPTSVSVLSLVGQDVKWEEKEGRELGGTG